MPVRGAYEGVTEEQQAGADKILRQAVLDGYDGLPTKRLEA